jgi:predicted SAM-dependent methyltransferase
MKLHLGCWHRYLDGYINIDIKGSSADLHADLRNLPFEDCTVDEIYASHVLEHFGRHEFLGVLKEWNRVLKAGGRIYVAVPDIDSAISYYLKHGDLKPLYGLIWGGQKDEYDHHKFGFTASTLTDYLIEAGFTKAERYDTFAYLPEGFDDFSKAYLPHKDFSGQLLSLNMTAFK